MNEKIYDSKLFFHNKRSDMHYLKVSTAMARDESYPFRSDDKIICAVNGNVVMFCKEEDKDDLLKEINNGRKKPTFKELIEEEKNDDVYVEW